MKKLGFILSGVVLLSSLALADGYTPPTIDVTPVMDTLGAVATALAGIWVVRKIVKLLNKS